MGYRIDYGGPIPNIPYRRSNYFRLRSMVAVAFLLFSLVVRFCWTEGTDMLRSLFLPGDLTVTEQAFRDMVDDLRHGVPIGDSVTVFCQRIVDESA